MKKGLLCLLIFYLIPNFTFAQKEANMWYFGEEAGIDFNGNLPIALSNSKIYAEEACATISDKSGKLLFYTNGHEVWNRANVRMSNGIGLGGSYSASQGVTIVRQPLQENIYFIFTLLSRDEGRYQELHYSVVDMRLDGGLGEITIKNKLLNNSVTESLTTVKHSNGRDVWVIVHGMGNNNFFSYLITPSGLQIVPVVSSIGSNFALCYYCPLGIGYIKASLDAKHLALSATMEGFIELFNFNNKSGAVTNPSKIVHGYAYGLEFSPDHSKLYVSSWGSSLYQYSLSNFNTDTIQASKKLLLSPSNWWTTGLQLGPDKKIYFAGTNKSYLGCINKPNNTGTECEVLDNYIYLNNKRARIGLPNFGQTIFYENPLNHQSYCYGDSTSFFYKNNYDSLKWNFNDPYSGANNFSEISFPKHKFTSSGIFNVELIVYYNSTIDTIFKEITIHPPPQSNHLKNVINCDQYQVILSVDSQFICLWQDGTIANSFIAIETGYYNVRLEDEKGCRRTDTIYVNLKPQPPLVFDQKVCRGLGTSIIAEGKLITWYSDPMATNRIAEYNPLQIPQFDSIGIFHYYCSQTIGQCTSALSRADIHVVKEVIANFDQRGMSSLTGQPIDFKNNTLYAINFYWDFGDKMESDERFPSHIYQQPGIYNVRLIASNETCSDTIERKIEVDEGIRILAPNAFTCNGDGLNDIFKITANGVTYFKADIFNRWGSKIFEWDDSKSGWDGSNSPAGIYIYVVSYKLGTEKIYTKYGEVTLIR